MNEFNTAFVLLLLYGFLMRTYIKMTAEQYKKKRKRTRKW